QLGGLLVAQQKWAEAEPVLREVLASPVDLGAGFPDHASKLATLGLVLLKQQKWAEAEKHLRECLTIREKAIPDNWRTFSTRSMLGEALLGQNKYQDAEPLLLKGYEGMKSREKTIQPQGKIRIPEALDGLIKLYSATSKP